MRQAKCYLLVHPDDCIPPHGLDLGSKHDADKVEQLRQAFLENGFDRNYPALVGYPLNGKIQLMSGTHRHLAAKLANILLPVTIWLRSDIEAMWGTDLWPTALADIPVKDLERFSVADGKKLSPYGRVEIA